MTAVLDHTTVTAANVEARLANAVIDQYQGVSPLPVGSLTASLVAGPGVLGNVLEIRSNEGAVVVISAATNDLATVLMLGSANGGSSSTSTRRCGPLPSGVFARLGVVSASARPTSARLGRLFDAGGPPAQPADRR